MYESSESGSSSNDTGPATGTEATNDSATETTFPGGFSRRKLLQGLAVAGGVGALGSGLFGDGVAGASQSSADTGWKMKEPQLYTPWTEDVGPENAHPEYPRPQMVRDRWENLNGVWQFAGAVEGDSPPIGEELGERILVPYPVESGLSGIKRHETWMWYRHQFEVPNEWLVPSAHPGTGIDNNPNARRLLLHFERVDWEATVYVNGEKVTRHRGGYDHFVVDITDTLVEDGPQELVVGVYDPTGADAEPVGTQPKGRQGVGTGYKGEGTLAMTPSSGIWDTVWLEPVSESHISNLDMTPDLDTESLRLTIDATTEDATVVATAYDDSDENDDSDEKVGRVTGSVGEGLELPVPDPHRWSPEDPHLYNLEVELRQSNNDGQGGATSGGRRLDRVESYFGMRSIGKQTIGNTARPTLNGETLWHLGTLESGQWPDGLYTAPTDEALRYNLEAQKELGYNMVRKHVKIETRRWFYHADQVGLLVWQDMPNMHEGFDTQPRDTAVLENFERELREVVTEHDNHPSMAVWIPISEGWGINNDTVDYVRDLSELVSNLDPERLVDPHSGYDVGSNHDSGVGDVKDAHQYGTPWFQIPDPEPDRISALGEYTSTSLVLNDHKWGECNSDASAESFVSEYVDRIEALADFMVGRQLSASVYTATTGLENVCNGLITYDRAVLKPSQAENGVERVRTANESIIEQSKRVMGNVSIDVEAPDSYDSGSITGSPTSFDVSTTVSNPESTPTNDEPIENVATSLRGLPADWSVTTETATEFDSVTAGESVTATWEVTPGSTPDGDVTFEVVVDYAIGGKQFRFDPERTMKAIQLAYWRFENSPEDSSSYDNALTLKGDASFDDRVAREGDYSLQLDGDGDYAMISDFNTGILHDAFSERTVSMWVNPNTTTGDQVLFNEGGYHNGFGVRITDGTLDAGVKRKGTLKNVSAQFSSTDWTHVAVVFDHGAFRLYVNGEEVAANETVGFDTVPGHIAGSELGGNETTSPWVYDEQNKFFDGHIDATSIYSRALSGDRIAGLSDAY